MCKTMKQTQEWKMYLNLLKQYRKTMANFYKKMDQCGEVTSMDREWLPAENARKKLDAFILTNILIRNVSQLQKYQTNKQKK